MHPLDNLLLQLRCHVFKKSFSLNYLIELQKVLSGILILAKISTGGRSEWEPNTIGTALANYVLQEEGETPC
jgi:hypothetical protein